MNPLRKITQDGQEILVVDFSGLKENEMIQLVSDSRTLLLTERRPQKLLILLNHKNYISSKLMRHIENHKPEALQYSLKQAVVGLSFTQRMILKGYNILLHRDVKDFGSQDEAMAYLLQD